jgi:hypothetical protein
MEQKQMTMLFKYNCLALYEVLTNQPNVSFRDKRAYAPPNGLGLWLI